MNYQIGTKFYDSNFICHEIIGITSMYVFHKYRDGNRVIEGTMYRFVFEKLLKIQNMVIV